MRGRSTAFAFVSCRMEKKQDEEKRKKAAPMKRAMWELVWSLSGSSHKPELKLQDTNATPSDGETKRDSDAYVSLKQALQRRLYDILLNWDLLSDP